MQKLNTAVWRLGFIISAIPACWISYYIFDFLLTVFPFEYVADINDEYIGPDGFWLRFVPVVFGLLGYLVNILTTMSEVFELESVPPDPDEYPVPFLGLSKNLLQMFYTSVIIALYMGLFCILALTIPFCLPAFVTAILGSLFLLPVMAVFDAVYLAAAALAKRSDERQYDRCTGSFVCPECGKKSRRPDYDAGGTIISGLRPGVRGIHKIEMETEEVPCCGSDSGRKNLPQFCPECGASVKTREAKPFVISLAGAASSGKTSFALAATGEILSGSSPAHNYHAEHDAALSDHDSGFCKPTPVTYSKPYVAVVATPELVTDRNLYMFDIGGDFFSGTTETDYQPQYSFNDAIVFTLDPSCADAPGKASAAYIGFIEKYRRFNRMDMSEKISVPLSVVATHADRPEAFGGENGKELRDHMAEEGFFGLVNMIEKDFSSVSYFSCVTNKRNGSSKEVVKDLCGRAGSELARYL